jgi:hypothetical protein
LLATTSGAITHIAVPSSETSTTGAAPVRSRWSSAAAMPPAIVMAPIESPKAGRCMVGKAASGRVSAAAMPPRDQKAVAS